MTGQRTIAVVIVNWNARDELVGLLGDLEAVEDPPLRVIVVDNASRDGSVPAVRSQFPEVEVLENESNIGLAAANNLGIERAGRCDVLICNPDVRFEPKTVSGLARVLDERPRVGIVVPLVRQVDGSIQTSAGDLPSLRAAVVGRRLSMATARGTPTGFWFDGWAHDEERSVGHGAEACYLVRRSAIDDVGLQDPAYVLDWEGIDWAERFSARGWEIWFTPEVEVVHIGGVSIRQARFRWIVRSHRGMYRYFEQRSAPFWRPILVVVFGARAAIKAASSLAGVLRSRLPKQPTRGPR